MKIVSLDFEIVRATPAVAEFLVHVKLEGTAADCEITGLALGPRRAGASTVEVAYPMNREGESHNTVTLRCVIPEPNLWTPQTPFTYAITVELRCGEEVVESRDGTVVFRGT
jgi:hypothetical protein